MGDAPPKNERGRGHPHGSRHGLLGFLHKEVPASLGWRNTLGSILGALLLSQLLTGVLLALYYVPHPEAAYSSVKYIEESVTAGRLTRSLHYWGASFVIVFLFLHVARVFFSGGYRKPRQYTWIIGLVLLVLTLVTTFLGQLLPWDQSGYWAATVGTEIAASAPYVGSVLNKLLVAGESLGALTLTRFYALHVIVLPLLLVGGITLHFKLLRRHGRSRPAEDTSDDTVPYAPSQLSRDLIAISIVLVALIGIAAIFHGPDAPPADPSDTTYVPHPEWYFAAPYQLMQYVPGDKQVFATVHLPCLLLLLLIALPWLDRAPTEAVHNRRIITTLGGFVLCSIIVLTALGVVSDPPDMGEPAPTATYDMVAAGRIVYERERCNRCHIVNGEGRPDKGPDLSGTGLRLQATYLKRYLPDPEAYYPETSMSAVEVSPRELNELIAYLMSLTAAPDAFVEAGE